MPTALQRFGTTVGSHLFHKEATLQAKRMGLSASHRGSRSQHVDLHLHSWFSDGDHSPAELAAAAHYLGLRAVALADHDTHAGLPEMNAACQKWGIPNVPAVELTVRHHGDKGYAKAHILGFHMRFEHGELLRRMAEIQEAIGHNLAAIVRMLKNYDVEITAANTNALFPQGLRSKNHLIHVLMLKTDVIKLAGTLGISNDLGEYNAAGNIVRWLEDEGPEIQPPPYFALEESIELIHADGGLPIWAHPWEYDLLISGAALEYSFANNLWGAGGLRGINLPLNDVDGRASGNFIQALIGRIRATGLDPIIVRGSDFHGMRDSAFKNEFYRFGGAGAPDEMGKLESMPGSFLNRIKEPR